MDLSRSYIDLFLALVGWVGWLVDGGAGSINWSSS